MIVVLLYLKNANLLELGRVFGSQTVGVGEEPVEGLTQQASRENINAFNRAVATRIGIPEWVTILAKSGRNASATMSMWNGEAGKMWAKGSTVPEQIYARTESSQGQVGSRQGRPPKPSNHTAETEHV